MDKSFEYFYVEQPQDTLTVPCIGNTCIKMYNDLGYYWYLQITTNLGYSEILQHGPYEDESAIPANQYQILYTKMAYDEKKLCNIIAKDLQSPKRGITQASLVDVSEAENAVKNMYRKYYVERNDS